MIYCFIINGKDKKIKKLKIRIMDFIFNKIEEKILLGKLKILNYSLDIYEIKCYVKLR